MELHRFVVPSRTASRRGAVTQGIVDEFESACSMRSGSPYTVIARARPLSAPVRRHALAR